MTLLLASLCNFPSGLGHKHFTCNSDIKSFNHENLVEFLEADHLIQDSLDYCCGKKKVTLVNIRHLPPWGEQSTEHKTLSL